MLAGWLGGIFHVIIFSNARSKASASSAPTFSAVSIHVAPDDSVQTWSSLHA